MIEESKLYSKEPLLLFPGDAVEYNGSLYMVVGSYASCYPTMINAKTLFSRDFNQYCIMRTVTSPRKTQSWVNRESLTFKKRISWRSQYFCYREIYASILERCAGRTDVLDTNNPIVVMDAVSKGMWIPMLTPVFVQIKNEDTSQLIVLHGHIVGRTADMIGDNPKEVHYNIALDFTSKILKNVSVHSIIPDEVFDFKAYVEDGKYIAHDSEEADE